MLGVKDNASSKKDNAPTLWELQAVGVGEEETNKIVTDGDKCFEK